jgi:hypothetical protein
MNYSELLIDNLGLSNRTTNALKNYGLNNLEEIIKISADEFLINKIPNLGIKSIAEIDNLINNLDLEKLLEIENTQNEKLIALKGPTKFSNIKDCIDWLFEKKFQKRSHIIKKRIFDGATLEECGKEIGITRERIRQIEKMFFSKLIESLNDNYKIQIQDYLDNNAGINGFFELEKIGLAYENLSAYLAYGAKPEVFLNVLFRNQKLFKWQKKKNEYYLYSYDGDSLEELINDDDLIDFINNSQSPNLKDSVKVYCLINNQESNFDYIYPEIQKKLTKRKSFACMYAVTQLKKTESKITLKQVIEFIKINCGKDFSQQHRTIENILNPSKQNAKYEFNVRDSGLYISAGAGNYFFLDKIPITYDEKVNIINASIEIMNKNPEKNFHSREFLEYINQQKLILDRTKHILDYFIIDAILLEASDNYDVINYVGRSLWSGNKNALKHKRIEIYPTVLKIIEANQAPMTLAEIKKELLKVRGAGKNIQLHTTLSSPKLIKVSQGYWGLRDRDINVTNDEEKELIKLIKDNFKQGKKILNFFDIKKIKEYIGINHNVSVYQLMRILLAHIPVGRRKTPKQLIFLYKINRENPLNFCFYDPEISDDEAQKFLDSNMSEVFNDVRNNEDSARSNGANFLIEGIEYSGRKAVAEKYNISIHTVGDRIRSKKYLDWKKI